MANMHFHARTSPQAQLVRNKLAIPEVTYLVIASLHREHVGAFGIFSKVEVFLGACNLEVAQEADQLAGAMSGHGRDARDCQLGYAPSREASVMGATQ